MNGDSEKDATLNAQYDRLQDLAKKVAKSASQWPLDAAPLWQQPDTKGLKVHEKYIVFNLVRSELTEGHKKNLLLLSKGGTEEDYKRVWEAFFTNMMSLRHGPWDAVVGVLGIVLDELCDAMKSRGIDPVDFTGNQMDYRFDLMVLEKLLGKSALFSINKDFHTELTEGEGARFDSASVGQDRATKVGQHLTSCRNQLAIFLKQTIERVEQKLPNGSQLSEKERQDWHELVIDIAATMKSYIPAGAKKEDYLDHKFAWRPKNLCSMHMENIGSPVVQMWAERRTQTSFKEEAENLAGLSRMYKSKNPSDTLYASLSANGNDFFNIQHINYDKFIHFFKDDKEQELPTHSDTFHEYDQFITCLPLDITSKIDWKGHIIEYSNVYAQEEVNAYLHLAEKLPSLWEREQIVKELDKEPRKDTKASQKKAMGI